MRVLITRPRIDSDIFARILAERGHQALVAPLMDVIFQEGLPLQLGDAQAVLATSASGVRAFARRSDNRDVPLYAVGPQTAETARETGFTHVFSAAGDSIALAEFVSSKLDPAKGSLLHAAGSETLGRLRQALQAKGFGVTTEVLYAATQVAALPEIAAAALRDRLLDAVTLFSPRSARIFAELVAAAALSEACGKIEAYCISAATAGALSPLSFARVTVAGEPNQEAMLALIG